MRSNAAATASRLSLGKSAHGVPGGQLDRGEIGVGREIAQVFALNRRLINVCVKPGVGADIIALFTALVL